MYEAFGYQNTKTIEHYYMDGEDAYCMELLDFTSHYSFQNEQLSEENDNTHNTVKISKNKKNNEHNYTTASIKESIFPSTSAFHHS